MSDTNDTPTVLTVQTPLGPGRLTAHWPATDPVGVLVLGHGAGGLTWSADITAIAAAATDLGWLAVLADQPWRVAGRKVAAPPAQLDRAWAPLVQAALGMPSARLPLVVSGRSAGARVACRTADALAAAGVLAVSFPLHPPGKPHQSRADELREPRVHGIPMVVLQGQRDPFGTPEEVRAELPADVPVVAVSGTHSFRAGPATTSLAASASAFLAGIAAP